MVSENVPFQTDQLRRYIRFARTMNPMLTKESRKVLVDCYRLLRQNDILGRNKTAYRITVRQVMNDMDDCVMYNPLDPVDP